MTAPNLDEAKAIEVLEKIRELAGSLYPWRNDARLHPDIPFALGSIRWIADRTIKAMADRK